MSFPQPAGYYGLKLSEEAEAEITKLSDKPLLELLHDVITAIRFRVEVTSFVISNETHTQIVDLSPSHKIALVRWLGDLLAFLHTVPVQEVKS